MIFCIYFIHKMSSRKRKRQIYQEVEQNKEKRLKDWFSNFGDEDFQAYTPEAPWDMILDHPQATWDWEYLSTEKELTTIIIHSNLPWVWKIVSRRADLEDVKNHIDLPWDWTGISIRVSYENFMKYEHDFPWNWRSLSHNNKMGKESIVRAHIDKPWNWDQLSIHEDVATLAMLRDFPDKPWGMFAVTQNHDWETIKANLDINWDWHSVSSKKELTREILEQNPDKPWNYGWISWNQDIVTLEMILTHPERNWDWYPISNSPIAIWENIVSHDLHWDWKSISRWNPYITRNIIDENQDMPWDYNELSCSRHLSCPDLEYLINKYPSKNWCWRNVSIKVSWEFVKSHLELEWDWLVLSDRKEVASWKNVEETIDKTWDWNILSNYEDVATPEHVEQYPEIPWNYGVLIGLWKRLEHDKITNQDLAAKKIQKWWRDILWDPLHRVGRGWVMKKIMEDIEAMDKRDRRSGN